MQGQHLTADLHGCTAAAALMREPQALRALCLRAVADAGLHAVGDLFHGFPAPGGVTGMVLLAESHLAIHTWPELAAVTLDVYVCNVHADHSARAAGLLAALEGPFGAAQAERRCLPRGALMTDTADA